MDCSNLTYIDLMKSIQDWNELRVPILRLSQPDSSLNFEGAMRFYFQESGEKPTTKCVNVKSTDTTEDVIKVLIKKFRPGLRMLTENNWSEYGLYEIYKDGSERKLELDERPIFVQLKWGQDDRDGRFLLRKLDEKTGDIASQHEEPILKRQLSKKEKKQEKLKKQTQKEQEKADAAANKLATKNKNGIAQKLYNELPETSFTRSISNPEAVMKRRRAQKLEQKLQEFSQEGGQEAGGTLRIFGESINKDISYKTLLLSTKHTASFVVKQILDKYNKENEDPSNYCLVKLIVPPSATSPGSDNNSVHDFSTSAGLKESILEDNDCPLLINQNFDKSCGLLTFHIRPRPSDYQKRRKKKTSRAQAQQNLLHPQVVQQLNQRLQLNNSNNNSDQFRDQNSPQNSSQTSDSLNHDLSNPPPLPLETIQSMPTLYPPRMNGNSMMYYQQQPHSISTLPKRINNHPITSNMHETSTTLQRPNYNNHQQRLLAQNHIQSNQSYPVPHIPNQQNHTHEPTQPAPNFPILPALIQVAQNVEDIFLDLVITQVIPTEVSFRLAPTYALYMVSRHRASTYFRPDLQAPSRAALFVPFARKIASMIRNTIEAHARNPIYLAFWLANSSDLCHFYKQDMHLSHFTLDAQEILYDSIKASFKYLLSCKQLELDAVLNTFFDERDDSFDSLNNRSNLNNLRPVGLILDILDETMATMRKNRVNAALTIQIFSYLFHHISKWLFDRLIGVYDNRPGLLGNQQNYEVYCNRLWGEKLNGRLAAIENWAEKQGLEEAAKHHLCRVTQTTCFLSRSYPRNVTHHDLKDACDKCELLNPVQLKALLRRYKPEQPIISAIIEDLLHQYDYFFIPGDYNLEEDFGLRIPFLIPEDGYSSEWIRKIPNGLLDFVSSLTSIYVGDMPLCNLLVQEASSGHWTVYFKSHQPPDTPPIVTIELKKINDSMGLSIMAAQGPNQKEHGIYIKSVVKNGAAAQDGRLQAGDQILKVDGKSLLGITQESAAERLVDTGPFVKLTIAKQAAKYHKVQDIIDSVPTQTIIAAPQQHQHQHQQHQQHQQHLTPLMSLPQAFAPPPPPPVPIPPPPVPVEPVSHQNSHLQSPMKSPKKVSWVDTQPHQSLHTLIPLPQEPEPSDMGQPTTNGHDDYPHNDNADYLDQNQHQQRSNNHREEEEDDDDDDDDDDSAPDQEVEHVSSNEQGHPSVNGQDDAAISRLADTTAASLTMEDIDKVLSSEQLEDSAGVIGTQEVYNDPRLRIVEEREREIPIVDANTEQLSFQEKLKMFNLSAKK